MSGELTTRKAGGKAERFQRGLHRSYRLGTAVNFFLTRRVRPAGIGLIVVLGVTGVLGVGQTESPQQQQVFLIFSFAAALGLLAIPLAFFRRVRGIRARRHLPRYATAGEQVWCSIHLTNHGRTKARTLWLAETPPDPRPPLELFLKTREPGEEKRNPFDRKFIYYRWQWLLDRLKLFDGGQSTHPVSLKPGESTEVPVPLRPARRGVVRLDDLRLLLPDPFGLFQRCVKLEAAAATLTVLPARHRLPPVELPGSGRFQIGGDAATNAIGTSGEFVGLRDYRPGDPLRQIHWKSWARLGRPIVKELEDTFYPRHGMVLDTFPHSGEEPAFEDAVSIAASFASTIDTRETLLDLMFIKDRAHTVTVGRGVARPEILLEVLAAVEPESTPQFDTLANLVIRHREELTSCLVVLCGWSEDRAAFVRRLTGQGLACVVLATGQGGPPPGFPGHWIEAGELARDLGKLPVRLKPFGMGPSS